MSRLTQKPGFTSRSTDWRGHVQIPHDIIIIVVGASFAHDNQGGASTVVRTSGNTTVHSRCELRMGHRRRSPGGSAGSRQGMYGGAMVDIFGLACRSSWSGMMVL
jgi:hypothetical protein